MFSISNVRSTSSDMSCLLRTSTCSSDKKRLRGQRRRLPARVGRAGHGKKVDVPLLHVCSASPLQIQPKPQPKRQFFCSTQRAIEESESERRVKGGVERNL